MGNSQGREDNAAQPLGERPGLVPERKRKAIAEEAKRSAGPDGGDAREVGDTFKKSPGGQA